jgi:hypothetical protein
MISRTFSDVKALICYIGYIYYRTLECCGCRWIERVGLWGSQSWLQAAFPGGPDPLESGSTGRIARPTMQIIVLILFDTLR